MQDSIATRLAGIEVGDLVRWNDRTAPEVVEDVSADHFDVRTSQHDYYRFYVEEGVVENRGTDERARVESFEVVGDVCDVDLW
ncbi:hypothetical protein [Halorubellus salinus]|uniref:hypothetical protein n=1 Tax=Halorubellus salinus TaxID=755309 RepID=UPI001D089B05|nr:hypothetical protein [Halorubellus salinus]